MELYIIVLLFLVVLFLRQWWSHWSSAVAGGPKNVPPGPPRWPLVGNLFQIILQRRHFVFVLGDLCAKYGPIFTLQLGQRTLVIITSSELIHEALVEKGSLLASRPPESPFRDIFSLGKCSINSAEYGPLWRTLRRNFITELLNPKRMKQSSWIRSWAIESHIKRLEHQASIAGYVEVMSHCRLTICSIFICLCFGLKVSEDRIKMIQRVLEDVVVMNWPKLPDFLPVLMPLFRRQMEAAKQLRRKQVECLVPLIRKRKAFVEGGGNPSATTSEMASPIGAAYVDSLLELEAPGRGKLGEEEMVTLCSEVINSGTDTSATTVEWALLHLVQNQEIQEKLHREIVDCVGEKREVTESDVEKMPYLGAIVKETFRRKPPTHLLFTRAATKELEVGGYTIPADAYVEFYTAGLTRDPDTWQNPNEFRPERFLTGDGVDVDLTGTKGVKMLPFGAGRRICPAWSLGTLQVSLLLARMVQAFKWIPIPDNPPDPTETVALTVVMKNPLKAIILPRTKI